MWTIKADTVDTMRENDTFTANVQGIVSVPEDGIELTAFRFPHQSSLYVPVKLKDEFSRQFSIPEHYEMEEVGRYNRMIRACSFDTKLMPGLPLRLGEWTQTGPVGRIILSELQHDSIRLFHTCALDLCEYSKVVTHMIQICSIIDREET